MLNPGRRPYLARRVNVSGTNHTIEACSNADVAQIIYLSSTSVYGAHPDNPEFLNEEDPIRPVPGFQYSEDKAAAEASIDGIRRTERISFDRNPARVSSYGTSRRQLHSERVPKACAAATWRRRPADAVHPRG